MQDHHYLGAGPLCGAQLRYLIHSERHGFVGALSFSAAAWSVAARDQHIQWSSAARERNLPRVVCNSRFLIPPTVCVKNLASHALGMAVERLAPDWRARYGYEPVLVETYVEKLRFEGTCYRAANWLRVGETQGRGRQDRTHEATAPVKDVYVYPLCREWRDVLCVEPPKRMSLPPKPTAIDWAEEEFGGAQVEDERLRKRLCLVARDFYARPQSSIPDACGSLAKTKAVYRLMQNERINLETVLRPHCEQTVARMAEHPVVLAVQDTTTLNYSTHRGTTGLGPINTAVDGAIGLHLHSTLAFTETGLPLGVLDEICWARLPETYDTSEGCETKPIEEKESYRWLMSYEAVAKVQKRCPKTLILVTGDRESDIYELFVAARSEVGGPGLLIRAERTRQRKVEHGHLWEVMANAPVAGEQELVVPRRGNRAERVARLAIRYASVELVPPGGKRKLGSVRVRAVYACEIDGPVGTEPIEWMLLTTMDVNDDAQAQRVLRLYTQRWGIEVWHRTLKSGCRIEDRQLHTAEGLGACLAIDMVVAWRIHHLTKLGRETPDSPCTVFFAEGEWKALVGWVKRKPIPPPNPPTLHEAVRMVGTLGGFLGRKSDGEPGTECLWRGLERLADITGVWSYLSPMIDPSRVPVSRDDGCG
ncbi:MAG: IS4 family transposase [Planctomycetes bacterium]|nr:IS4 family transposase [Planctomycetota bacterium]